MKGKQKFFTITEKFVETQSTKRCGRCHEAFRLGEIVEARRNMYPQGLFHAKPCLQTAKDAEEDLAQGITVEERCLYRGNAQEVQMISEDIETGNFPDNLERDTSPMERF